MGTALALLVGWLLACAVHLMLSRDLFRVVLGAMMLTSAANVAIVVLGRVRRAAAPFVPEGAEQVALDRVTNPLPQAFVLTAIVIGLAIFAFTLALLVAVSRRRGALDVDALRGSERTGGGAGPDAGGAEGDRA